MKATGLEFAIFEVCFSWCLLNTSISVNLQEPYSNQMELGYDLLSSVGKLQQLLGVICLCE